MGIFDKAIERLATQISKAAPAPIVTPITDDQIRNALEQYGTAVGLPRDPRLAGIPFSPGLPLVPSSINPLGPDGRPAPRRYEYASAQNINVTPTKLVPFSTLRAAAEQIDILRRCIEVLKSKILGMDWDIVLGEDAVEKIMAETGERSYTKAMQIAKDKYGTEIDRLKEFWEMPDVSNGLVFSDWLNMALEDILVLDALAIYPQRNIKGELKGLQIIDGSTIKPLIDDRGMRPTPPNPAFQQILYGFPRSEFAAADDSVDADGEFSSDELAYLVKNRRSNSIYGYSPTERALPIADIYLRRQQWIRAEYTDGVIPELLLKSDGTFTPDQIRAYENILNDYLSGQTEQRKRATILTQGLEPVQLEGYGEKFKDTLDEYLITAITGHFGVQPSEIGMTAKQGLGNSGVQDGQASSAELIATIPLANWISKMLSHLSYSWLGAPRALEFKIMPSARTDFEAVARANDIKLKNGTLTRNEARSREGLPLLNSPVADQPTIYTGADVLLITEQGVESIGGVDPFAELPALPEQQAEQPAIPDQPEAAAAPVAQAEDNTPTEQPSTQPDNKAARNELYKFMRWIRNNPKNTFAFEHVPATYAETLNKFISVEDFEGARWYAERYLA
jgi:hypothetical protein